MITENLGIFLQDFGVPCSCGAHNFSGILDSPTEVFSMGQTEVLADMHVLTVQTSDVAAGAIEAGSAITANGKPFTVRAVYVLDDGAFSNLHLSP